MEKLDNMQTMLTQLTTTIGTIQTDIKDLKTNKARLDRFLETADTTQTTLENFNKKNRNEALRIKMLTATIIRQDQQITALSETVENLTNLRRRPNLFISGLLENADQTSNDKRCEVVQKFFEDKMAFRVRQAKPRVIKVVLQDPRDKATIFSNASNLKGKKNARKKLLFVNDDVSEAQREQRQFFQMLKKDNRLLDEEDQLQISLKKGKLMVNNATVKPKLQMPNVVDIHTLTDDELGHIEQVKVYNVPGHEEAGSEFMCYFQRINSVDEVQQGLVKLKIKHGDATHIPVAYRLANSKGPYNQEYLDNQEFGAGRRILNVLKQEEITNVAVFTPRYYGGQKMGARHFQIYQELAERAVKILKQRLAKLSRRNRSERSNSQLSQMSMEDDHAEQHDLAESGGAENGSSEVVP